MDAEKKLTVQEAADKGLLSQDVAEEKRELLKQLFPEVFTEDNIDFEQLRRVMGDWVEPGKERYGLNWPGKADCMKVIQAPSIATLKPARDESTDFDDTDNLFVEGDNLEVLKLLQKAYFGRIKMIYIDPPYNTGGEFIYPDKYQENLETYLAYTGQVDDEGRKFSTNTDAGGRFHANWLNMMYPRLYLARNLLREDGVIFISIDDSEQSNLKLLCDIVFGEKNFVSSIIWQKKYAPQNDAKYFSENHDFLLCYARNIENFKIGLLPRSDEANSRYKNPDNDPRGPWKSGDLTRQEFRPNDQYEIVSPVSGKTFRPPSGTSWRRPQEKMRELIADNRIWFGPEGTAAPSEKRFLSEVKQGITPQTIWERKDVGDTQEAKKLLKTYFGNGNIFETSKPPRLIQRAMLVSGVSENDIVLDFFAGSCSTAEAFFSYDSNVKFIAVQLPEICEEKSEAAKEGFSTIAEIGKERIRRAAKAISDETQNQLDLEGDKKSDLGFKVFKLSQSNFSIWDGDADEVEDLAAQLEMHVDHIDQASGPEDILYELLLKAGFELTTKVEKQAMAGKEVFSVADGALLICLDKEITPELIDALADADPLQVICLDEGFKGNDQLKTNAVQTFKSRAKEDEEAIVFRTV